MRRRRNACKNRVNHQEPPEDITFNEHEEWLAGMRVTHRQKKCDGCGLYHIWTPLEREKEAVP